MRYQLPAGFARVEPVQTPRREISTGSTRLRVRNEFDFPLHMTVTRSRGPADARLLDLPPSFRLAPGERFERVIRFESDHPLEVGRVEFG